MLQNFNRFNVCIFMLNNEMRPYESDADHRRQTCDALSVSRVCVLYVEARRFYGAEGRFNLPTLFVAFRTGDPRLLPRHRHRQDTVPEQPERH